MTASPAHVLADRSTYICDPEICTENAAPRKKGWEMRVASHGGTCWHKSTARRLAWSGPSENAEADLKAWQELGR